MDVDRCICCDAPVPEGRMLCPWCESGYTPDKREDADDEQTP